jgi:hypothetical protein
MTSPAWLSNDIAPQPSHLGSDVDSMTQHHHQYDSLSTSCHYPVISVAPSPTWLVGSARISSTSNRLGGSPLIRLGGLRSTTSTDNPTWVHGHWSLILNRGEHIITNKIMGHFIEPAKSYLYPYFLTSQYLSLNLFFTDQYTTSCIITSWGLHVSCYTAPILTSCQFF